jgi:hypothetical protein
MFESASPLNQRVSLILLEALKKRQNLQQTLAPSQSIIQPSEKSAFVKPADTPQHHHHHFPSQHI